MLKTFFALLGLTLSLLFLDIGTKWTAWKYENPNQGLTDQGIISNLNPFQMLEQIIQLLKKYKINYLVLEREEEDHLPLRKDQDFTNYLFITHSLLIYCQLYQIKGCVILPRTQSETRKWREQKNYCWRNKYSQNEYYCDAHQRIAKTKIGTLDEVDVKVIREIFYQKLLPNPFLLKERERIFNQPMNIKEVEDYQKTYTERTNQYRIKQTYAPKET